MTLLLGPRTLSGPVLSFLAVAGLLGAFVGDPDADDATRMMWLGAGVVAQCALTGVYLIATVLGARQSRTAVLVTVILGAATRAVALSLLVQHWGIADPLSTPSRLLSATVTYTAWGIVFGLVVQGYAEYRFRLVALLTRVDRALEEAQALAGEWQARLLNVDTAPEALERTAKALHDDVEKRLRPLSHRLWLGLTQHHARDRFLKALLTEPLPIPWIIAAIVPLYLWPIAYQVGLLIAATTGCMTALGVGGILRIGERAAQRWPGHAAIVHATSIVIAAGMPAVVDWATADAIYPAETAVVILALLTAIISVQVVAVALSQRKRSLTDLRDRVDDLERQRRDVATYLHTTLQSRWTAAALQLQDAAAHGDAHAAQHALAHARSLLDESGLDTAPKANFARVALAWEGIVAVTLAIPPDIPADAQSTLSTVIEEAIANSVRHGRSRNVSVLITVTEDTVDVVVTDDGIGPGDHPREGLGSRWRTEVSRWELTGDESGARLIASIPREMQ
mgnify:CR=1 FL=1|jgi:hypothetical protein